MNERIHTAKPTFGETLKQTFFGNGSRETDVERDGIVRTVADGVWKGTGYAIGFVVGISLMSIGS